MKRRRAAENPVQAKAPRGETRYVLGFFLLVVFPGFLTIAAPVSRVNLAYDGEVVSARVRWFIYLVVPYRTTGLDRVTRVGSDFTAGPIERSRGGGGQSRSVRTEDSAELVLGGPDGELTVPISPVNIASAAERVETFLAHPDGAGLSLLAVSNWKFAVFGGGLASLLTLLYVAGIVLEVALWIYRLSGRGRLAREGLPTSPDPDDIATAPISRQTRIRR